LWITLWDNETGYHVRILKDTDKDIYGYIKVMQAGYNEDKALGYNTWIYLDTYGYPLGNLT
jgi:hypothetical protein